MISYAAIIILNIIALIAILVANREFSRALREIDRLSTSRLSRSSASLINTHCKAKE